jgi:hypothetical protein
MTAPCDNRKSCCWYPAGAMPCDFCKHNPDIIKVKIKEGQHVYYNKGELSK